MSARDAATNSWCERNGHDFEPHEEDGVTRCTVCGANPVTAQTFREEA